jgi:hypothetical protein
LPARSANYSLSFSPQRRYRAQRLAHPDFSRLNRNPPSLNGPSPQEIYRGAEYVVTFLPKIRIEVAVPSDRVEQVVEAIITSAKTGQIGDGKIFVTTIDQAVRIRTGETDVDAL